MRCHQCAGFNHTKDICKNKLACGYCGKDHQSNECDEETETSVNCLIANEKYSLNLETNHNVWSKKCVILKRKIDQASKRTDYVEKI